MQRAEIITVERRRRWSLSEKQELVAETLRPGASVSAVAQRHGMHPSQLFAWRKAARDERLFDDRRDNRGVRIEDLSPERRLSPSSWHNRSLPFVVYRPALPMQQDRHTELAMAYP